MPIHSFRTCLAAFLATCFPLVAAIPYQNALDAAAVTLPSISNISTHGLVVGNGELNAIVHSSGNEIRLRVSKNDVWDTRIDTSADPALPTINPAAGTFTGASGAHGSWNNHVYPTALPCTEIVLAAAAGQTSWTSAGLDLTTATATVTSNADTSLVRVLSQSNVILIDSPRPLSLAGISGLVTDHDNNPISGWVSPSNSGIQAGYPYLHQNIPGDADASGMDVYVVAGQSGSRHAVAVVTSRESATPLQDAAALVATTLADLSAVSTHEAAWRDFWSRSGVSLADATLQNWWYRMTYFFRCYARADGNTVGLQAAFDKLGGWHNALKFNYNIQQSYLAAGPINHPELYEPFIDVLLRNLKRAEWFANATFNVPEGAFFHSDLWPFEPDPAVCVTPNKHQQHYLPWGYTWGMSGHTASVIWEYYKYHPTPANLDRIYPILRGFALFYCSVLEAAPVEANGKRRIGPSYYPENGSYGQFNVSYDITFINFCLKAAREAATAKGEAALVSRIDALLPQIPAFTTVTDPSQGDTVIEQWRGAGLQSHENVGGIITPVFPAGEVTWFSSAAEKALLQRTIRRVENTTNHINSNVTINIARARLGLGEEAITNAKSLFAAGSATSPEQPNGLFFWKEHGYFVSEQTGIARFVSELLLQSAGDVIRVFPGWSATRDASFSKLLARGGFEVSADMVSGLVQNLRLTSKTGGAARVEQPWPGFTVNVTLASGGSVSSTVVDGIIGFATTAGETYLITAGVPTSAPGAPSGLAAIAGDGRVTLAWTPVPGAATYQIERSSDGASFSVVGSALGAGFVDRGLTNGAARTYRVTATNALGTSAPSSTATATPVPTSQKLTGTILGTEGSWNNSGNTRDKAMDGDLNTAFDAPTGSAWVGLDLGCGTIISQIRYAPRTTNPDRMVSGVFQGSATADFASPTTLFTITAQPPVGSHTTQAISSSTPFRFVRYLSPANGYGNAAEIEFFGTRQAPSAPVGLTVTPLSATSARLEWTNSSSDVISILVEHTPFGQSAWVSSPALSPGAHSHDISGLVSGTTYNFRVTAMNAGGDGAIRLLDDGLPGSPSGLTATAGNNQVTLTWTAAAGAESYRVKRSTTSGGPYTILATGILATTHVDASAANGTTYHYVVSAVNAAGEGADSAPASATPTSALPLHWNNSSTTWSTGSATWTSQTDGGGTPVSWTQGADAVFSAGAALTGSYTLTNGGVTVGSITQEESKVRVTSGTLTLGGAKSVLDVKTRKTGDYDLRVDSVIADPAGGAAALVKRGPGILLLSSANNTFSGGVTLEAGTLGIESGAVNSTLLGGGAITLGGGSFVRSFANSGIHITTPNTLRVTGAVRIGAIQQNNGNWFLTGNWLAGTTDGNFHVSNSAADFNGFAPSATTVFVTGNLAAYTGTISHTNLASGGNRLRFGNQNAGAVTLDASLATLATHGSTTGGNCLDVADGTFGVFRIGALSGTGGRIRAGWSLGGNTEFRVGELGVSTTYAGALHDNPNGSAGLALLTKVGNGTLTLSGSSSYSGATSVSQGGLDVTGALTGSGALSVAAGAFLSGTGTITGPAVLAAGSTLAPGHGGAGATGTLTLSGGATLNAGSLLRFDLAGTANSDRLQVGGSFVAAGVQTIHLAAVSGFAGAGTYPLVSGATGIAASNFTLGDVPAGFKATLSAAAGELSVTLEALTGIEAWRLEHFGTTANSGNAADGADPDGDGSDNLTEYLAGTDPNNGVSRFAIDSIQLAGGDVTVTFPSATGRIYALGFSETLAAGTWTTVQAGIPGTGGTVQVTASAGASSAKGFYRVSVSLP